MKTQFDTETLTEDPDFVPAKQVRKDSRITLRLSSEDLNKIKEKARAEGLPYQSLISGILHKYVTGAFVNVNDLGQLKSLMKW